MPVPKPFSKRSITPGGLFFGCVLASVSCGPKKNRSTELGAFRLATTTSTDQSGLLPYLNSAFTKATGIRAHVIAVGTGRALDLGRRGDVDAVLAHDEEAEKKLVREGHGVLRTTIMHNNFVLVGPPGDPASAGKAQGVLEAIKAVASSGSRYVSRVDGSGTAARDALLQKKAAVSFAGTSHTKAGVGMAQALTMASELSAYVLTDEATYETLKPRLRLVPFTKPEPLLRNNYSFILINPRRHPKNRTVAAMAYLGYLISEPGQQRIASYKMNGKTLFHPLAFE